MYILGLDTSCDDTSVGIIQVNNENLDFSSNIILANVKYSQLTSCVKYGGVVPEIAARTHLDNLSKTLEEALKTAKLSIEDIDYFSVTIGPGLIGSLIVGSNFIQSIAKIKNKPCILVHHLEGHIASCQEKPPFFSLVISGGHSFLAFCDENYNYEILCSTLDDSLGEVFDKVGRVFELPFPSGPFIEKLALESQNRINPIEIMKGKNGFSFSGLKTSCLNLVKTHKKEDICFFLQESAVNHLVNKISKFLSPDSKLIVCGGVASNQYIRENLKARWNCSFPPLDLCCDNGVMIALAAQISIYNNRFIKNHEEFASMTLSAWNQLKI